MGMEFNLVNSIQFFSYISPLLLGFFIVMTSFFNKNVKGVIYLAGVLLFSFVGIALKPLIGSKTSMDAHPTCNLFDIGDNTYNSPPFHSLFIAFTFTYLAMPMINGGITNYYVLLAILILFFMDTFTKITNKCTTPLGAFLGGMFGVLFGISYWALFRYTGNEKLLFFQLEGSNNVVCNRPSKQTFRCNVYKNGELINSTLSK